MCRKESRQKGKRPWLGLVVSKSEGNYFAGFREAYYYTTRIKMRNNLQIPLKYVYMYIFIGLALAVLSEYQSTLNFAVFFHFTYSLSIHVFLR